MKNRISLVIEPLAKPRMVKSDAWRKRPAVMRYWEFKDRIKDLAAKQGISDLPGELSIDFFIPMPKSWSQKKREEHYNKPHLAKPDLDNLIKAVQDCLCKSDSHIWSIKATKTWQYQGSIYISY